IYARARSVSSLILQEPLDSSENIWGVGRGRPFSGGPKAILWSRVNRPPSLTHHTLLIAALGPGPGTSALIGRLGLLLVVLFLFLQLLLLDFPGCQVAGKAYLFLISRADRFRVEHAG